MTITNQSIISRSPDQVQTEMQGEIALMHVESGKFFAVKSVLANLWRELEDPKSVDALVAAMMDIYDVSESECRQDIVEVLESMVKADLVRVQ